MFEHVMCIIMLPLKNGIIRMNILNTLQSPIIMNTLKVVNLKKKTVQTD